MVCSVAGSGFGVLERVHFVYYSITLFYREREAEWSTEMHVRTSILWWREDGRAFTRRAIT
jgi:hypothetical protein